MARAHNSNCRQGALLSWGLVLHKGTLIWAGFMASPCFTRRAAWHAGLPYYCRLCRLEWCEVYINYSSTTYCIAQIIKHIYVACIDLLCSYRYAKTSLCRHVCIGMCKLHIYIYMNIFIYVCLHMCLHMYASWCPPPCPPSSSRAKELASAARVAKAMNRFTVKPGNEKEFEQRWANRESKLLEANLRINRNPGEASG